MAQVDATGEETPRRRRSVTFAPIESLETTVKECSIPAAVPNDIECSPKSYPGEDLLSSYLALPIAPLRFSKGPLCSCCGRSPHFHLIPLEWSSPGSTEEASKALIKK